MYGITRDSKFNTVSFLDYAIRGPTQNKPHTLRSRVVRGRVLHFDIPVFGRVRIDPEVHAHEVDGSLLKSCRFIWVEVKKAWLVRGSRATSPSFPSHKIFLNFSAQGCKGRPPHKAKSDCVHIHTFFIQWII